MVGIKFICFVIWPLFSSSKLQPSMKSQGVKAYARVFPSLGIDPASVDDFEILDGSTFLNKQDPSQLVMHPFTFIFTPEFDYEKMVQRMNIVNEALEGGNQIIVAEIDKENIMNFMLGNCKEPGFVLTLFVQIFQEAMDHYPTHANPDHHISLAIFSSSGASNQFVDLILGHRLSYFSKKDMDEHKNFYDREITELRQFLIALKMGIIRHGQLCQDGDPFVVRITVTSFDQTSCQQYETILHLIVAECSSPIIKQISRKIESCLQSNPIKGEDHGSLANYLQKQLRRSRLSYIYGLPFRKKALIGSQETFKFIERIRSLQSPATSRIPKDNLQSICQMLGGFYRKRFSIGSLSFTHKQFSLISKWIMRLIDFMNQAQAKWKAYCHSVGQLIAIQENFYEKERFPISLQIKDDNIKAFLNCKVYKLSEHYQIQDLSTLVDRIRTLKNQITIALRALPTFNEPPKVASLQAFAQYYLVIVSQLSLNIKRLFTPCYRHIAASAIKLPMIPTSSLFDTKPLKELHETMQKEAKRVRDKEEVFFRKLLPVADRVQQNCTPCLRNSHLESSGSFELFKVRKQQTISKSLGLKQINRSMVYPFRCDESQVKKHQKTASDVKGSLFPKIVVIHRKNRQ